MRIIGIQHRVKRTAEGESRPTQVALMLGEKVDSIDLETEQDELDFVLGVLPKSFRAPRPDEDVNAVLSHQIKWKELDADESELAIHESQIRVEKNKTFFAHRIPDDVEGLQPGDSVAMVLGGSGDALSYAFARRAETIGAKVFRIPSFRLKAERETDPNATKDDDDVLLAVLLKTKPELFYEVAARDRSLIRVTESWRALQEAMKARIACEQRQRQFFIGRVFTNPDGLFPEGGIEKAYDAEKASDPILKALEQEEARRSRDLEKALEDLDVYTEIFKPIEGMGPRIAGRIISAVGDIRRFETPAKLCAFLGVHVLKNGTLPRRRAGEVANWHGDGRQALYLSSDQWNKRPDSYWGKYLRAMKAGFRERHPTVELVENPKTGKKTKKYTDGHIHKMACWRTMTRFVRKLWQEWHALERSATPVEQQKAA